jgi:hypothetical protein
MSVIGHARRIDDMASVGGHKRTPDRAIAMSTFPSRADIGGSQSDSVEHQNSDTGNESATSGGAPKL